MAGLAYTLEVARPDCVADDFGGEIVALNAATGIYYSLTDLAAAVWRDLEAGHFVKSIIGGIEPLDAQVAEEVAKFIDHVQETGLMRRTSPCPVEKLVPESVTLVSTGETRLNIQSFEDMKDLILADPIHEADHQLGWPALNADKVS